MVENMSLLLQRADQFLELLEPFVFLLAPIWLSSQNVQRLEWLMAKTSGKLMKLKSYRLPELFYISMKNK